MASPYAPRTSDVQLLGWLKERHAGISPREIAKRDGVRDTTIYNLTNKVKVADRAHDPDDFQPARYW